MNDSTSEKDESNLHKTKFSHRKCLTKWLSQVLYRISMRLGVGQNDDYVTPLFWTKIELCSFMMGSPFNKDICWLFEALC